MPKLYRPPQGKFCESNLQMASELGYSTVFWSLAYVDWYVDDQPTKEQAFSKLLPRVHPAPSCCCTAPRARMPRFSTNFDGVGEHGLHLRRSRSAVRGDESGAGCADSVKYQQIVSDNSLKEK